jgi:hypothetical protein
MLEEVYVKMAMKKLQVYDGINFLMMAMQVSITIHTTGNRQLQQITKTLSMCTILRKVASKRIIRRCQWK